MWSRPFQRLDAWVVLFKRFVWSSLFAETGAFAIRRSDEATAAGSVCCMVESGAHVRLLCIAGGAKGLLKGVGTGTEGLL